MAVVGLLALKVVFMTRLEGLTSLWVWGNLILESRNWAGRAGEHCGQLRTQNTRSHREVLHNMGTQVNPVCGWMARGRMVAPVFFSHAFPRPKSG